MSNTKLTKTERGLLEKAIRSHRGSLYAMTWYSTSSSLRNNGKFGLRTHGSRAANALRSLCDKGLAEGFQADSNYGPNPSGFGSTHATEYRAKVTLAGREALQS